MTARLDKPSPEQLRKENEDLRARLEEAEETLRAIREGEVDAVIVSGSKGDRVFSLSETENLYRLMVETMSEAGVALSPDGLVLFCNTRASHLLQLPTAQIVGRHLREFVARQDQDRFDRLLKDAAQRVDDRILFVAADGSAVPMHLWASHLDRGEGPLVCLVGTDLSMLEASQDLIDQLQEQQRQLRSEMAGRAEVEEALRRNREWLRVTLTSIGDAVLVTDGEGRVTFLNPVAATLTGWTEQAALGQPADHVCRLFYEHTRHDPLDYVGIVLREKRAISVGNHTVLVTKDGREIPVDDSAAPILDETGGVVGVVVVFHDVTEKRRAQQALRVAEEHLRLAVEGADVGIWVIENDSPEMQASPRAKQLLGFAPDAPVSRDQVWERVHPEDRARARAVVDRTWTHGEPFAFEFRLLLPDGTVRWLQSRARPFEDGGRRRLYGILADVTPLKTTEEESRRRAEELQTLMDITPAAIVVSADRECLHLTGNRAARELFEAGEHENLAPRADRTFARNGRDVPVADLPMQVAAATGREVRDTELEAVLPSGKRVTIWGSATPLFDSAGQVRGCIGAFADITERKRVEQALKAARDSAERAKADAEAATKAKDRFLAVLSHELRTPLTPVLTGISLLEMHASKDAREYLDIIRRNVELESRLIDDLLDLTRISQGRVELHRRLQELSTIVERAVEVCRSDIAARRLEFGVDWKVGPCLVDADAARLQQVFWNLLKNSIKFTPRGGCVGIKAWTERDMVVIEVNDSGVGIDPAALPGIFDAFAQAEPAMSRQFGGLGLGLAISKALVEMHGGTIEGRSEGPGKGATFRVRLPIATAADAATSRADQRRAIAEPGAEHLRILLVEDHGDTAIMTSKLLALEGHDVQAAGDVASALQAMEHGQFDILISDLGLPDRSGLDLMRELRARGQALPAIALSGYGHQQDVERSRAAGYQVHLVKPVEPVRLLDAILRLTRRGGSASPGR